MKVYEIIDNIYEHNFFLFVDKSCLAVKRKIRYKTGVEFNIDDCEGACGQTKLKDGRWFRFIYIKSASDGVALTHETLHFAMRILKNVGIKVKPGGRNEALTYYHGYLIKKCTRALTN